MGNGNTEEIAAQAEAGDTTVVWHLARMMRLIKRRPRMAVAPVQDEQGRTVTDESELTALWVRQFSEEFSCQVTRVPREGLDRLLADRQAQPHCYDRATSSDGSQLALPTVVEEWLDFFYKLACRNSSVASRLAAIRRPTSSMPRLEKLGYCSWQYSFKRFKLKDPRSYGVEDRFLQCPGNRCSPFSPLNSRGILCADHIVKHFFAAIRQAAAPILTGVMAGNQSGAVEKRRHGVPQVDCAILSAARSGTAKVCGCVFWAFA